MCFSGLMLYNKNTYNKSHTFIHTCIGCDDSVCSLVQGLKGWCCVCSLTPSLSLSPHFSCAPLSHSFTLSLFHSFTSSFAQSYVCVCMYVCVCVCVSNVVRHGI